MYSNESYCLLVDGIDGYIWELVYDCDFLVESIDYIIHLYLSYDYLARQFSFPTFDNIKEFITLNNKEYYHIYDNIKNIRPDLDSLKFEKNMLPDYWKFFESIILNEINNVLNDNEEDRHHSAVYVTNIIKIFMNYTAGIQNPDVLSFFDEHMIEKKKYDEFEKLRIAESKYYRGLQL